jgi:hypothetical protein
MNRSHGRSAVLTSSIASSSGVYSSRKVARHLTPGHSSWFAMMASQLSSVQHPLEIAEHDDHAHGSVGGPRLQSRCEGSRWVGDDLVFLRFLVFQPSR